MLTVKLTRTARARPRFVFLNRSNALLFGLLSPILLRLHAQNLALKPLEPLAQIRIVRHVRRQHLDGDGAVQAGVTGFVDLTHAARAEGGDNFIRAQAGRRAEGHVGYGNGGAILPPVGLLGPHNGKAGVAGVEGGVRLALTSARADAQ